MQLDENILSKDEYVNALKGRRHFKDEGIWRSIVMSSMDGNKATDELV